MLIYFYELLEFIVAGRNHNAAKVERWNETATAISLDKLNEMVKAKSTSEGIILSKKAQKMML